jgi:hypothetical protein
MTWALALAFAKRAGSGVLSYLSRADAWQIVSLGLAALLIVQHFSLVAARHDAARWQKQATGLQTQINAVDTEAREAETQAAQLSKQLKDRTDEENRRIAGDANSLRLSGPGKAVCRPAPAAPSGHAQSGAGPDAPGPSLPTNDSAAVPWNWLVQRGEEHDQL